MVFVARFWENGFPKGRPGKRGAASKPLTNVENYNCNSHNCNPASPLPVGNCNFAFVTVRVICDGVNILKKLFPQGNNLLTNFTKWH